MHSEELLSNNEDQFICQFKYLFYKYREIIMYGLLKYVCAKLTSYLSIFWDFTLAGLGLSWTVELFH